MVKRERILMVICILLLWAMASCQSLMPSLKPTSTPTSTPTNTPTPTPLPEYIELVCAKVPLYPDDVHSFHEVRFDTIAYKVWSAEMEDVIEWYSDWMVARGWLAVSGEASESETYVFFFKSDCRIAISFTHEPLGVGVMILVQRSQE